MFSSGDLVKVTVNGTAVHPGVVIQAHPVYDRECDYYDGREISRKLAYVNYLVLVSSKESLSYLQFKTTDTEYEIRKLTGPELYVVVGEKKAKVTSLPELDTLCKAYDLVGIDYKVFMRLK